ncbi:MAG: plastocyanin/azurin family copper-binding protein [Egibacteraceae bacterium]
MMLMGPWLVLIVVGVIAAVWASQRRSDDRDDVAVQVLDRRLAEGDLTVEEHAQRSQGLHERGSVSVSRSGGWGGPVAAIAAATLVVILLIWFGMTSWGGGGWMGGHMGWRGSTSSTTQVVDGAREVDVEAGELWFDPATIQVTAGEPVNLRLVNTGEAFHDLTVPGADVVLAAEAGEQASGAGEFTELGRYEFYCSVPGHAQGGMRGTIEVTAAD